MRTGILQLAATCALLVAAQAHAEIDAHDTAIGPPREVTHDDVPPKSRVQASLGLGSPVGEIGASYTYAPIPAIQIELGTGIGYTGFQFSAMPKLSLAMGKSDRLVLGVGPSLSLDSTPHPDHTYLGYWLNAEVGYEHRTVSGFSILAAAGVTAGLGGEIRGHCLVDCDHDTQVWNEPILGKAFPQARIAFGRWF